MCLSWIIGTQGFVGEIGREDEGGNRTGNRSQCLCDGGAVTVVVYLRNEVCYDSEHDGSKVLWSARTADMR